MRCLSSMSSTTYIRSRLKSRRDDFRGQTGGNMPRPRVEMREALARVIPATSRHPRSPSTDCSFGSDQKCCATRGRSSSPETTTISSVSFTPERTRFGRCGWERGWGRETTRATRRPRNSKPSRFRGHRGGRASQRPLVQTIAEAAKELNERREAWLNPTDASEAELKKRTLTNLYNARPTWLANAHARLDRAVWDAYGWDDPDPDNGRRGDNPHAAPEAEWRAGGETKVSTERSLAERRADFGGN